MRPASFTALSVTIASAITGFALAPSAHAGGDCTHVTTASFLQTCFDNADGTLGAPTSIALGADITMDPHTQVDLSGEAVASLDLAGHQLSISMAGTSEAAIQIDGQTTLIVDDTSTNSAGVLTVVGGDSAAGIGSNGASPPGDLEIKGGTVYASAGTSSSGFGSVYGGKTLTIGSRARVFLGGESGLSAGWSGGLSNAGQITIQVGTTVAVGPDESWTNTGTITNQGTLTGVFDYEGSPLGSGAIVNQGTIIDEGTIVGHGRASDGGPLIGVNNAHLTFDVSAFPGVTAIDSAYVFANTAEAGHVTLPAVPPRAGYTATGWFTSDGKQLTATATMASLFQQGGGPAGTLNGTLVPRYSPAQTTTPTTPTTKPSTPAATGTTPTTWIYGLRSVTGPPTLRTGRSYTLITRATSRPTYYRLTTGTPKKKVRPFRRIAPNTWAVTLTITPAMKRATHWKAGIKTGASMRVFRVTVSK